MNWRGLFTRRPKPQPATKLDLQEMETRIIMATEAQTVAALEAISNGLTDFGTELDNVATMLAKALEELRGSLNGHHVPGAVEDKVKALEAVAAALTGRGATLKQAASALDDLIPDQAEPPVVVPFTEPPAPPA